MAAPGRGNVACTPAKQQRILWLVRRGWRVAEAAREHGMSYNAVYRQSLRDPDFARQLLAALISRGGNRKPRRESASIGGSA